MHLYLLDNFSMYYNNLSALFHWMLTLYHSLLGYKKGKHSALIHRKFNHNCMYWDVAKVFPCFHVSPDPNSLIFATANTTTSVPRVQIIRFLYPDWRACSEWRINLVSASLQSVMDLIYINWFVWERNLFCTMHWCCWWFDQLGKKIVLFCSH